MANNMHRALIAYTEIFKDEVKREVAGLERYWKLFSFFFFFIIGPSSQFEKHCSLVPVCNTKLGQMQSPLVFYLSFLYSPFEYKLSDFRNNV